MNTGGTVVATDADRFRSWTVAWSIITGLLAIGAVSADPVSFEERIRAQTSIEGIYHKYRISAPGSVSDQELRRIATQRVRTYLAQSVALEHFWNTSITREALDAELSRIVRSTKQPDRLREIFDALGNDPVLLRECLARPTLANRLAQRFFANDGRRSVAFHRDREVSRDARWAELADGLEDLDFTEGSHYGDVVSSQRSTSIAACPPDDSWAAGVLGSFPSNRSGYTQVWSGTELLIWGGVEGGGVVNSGFRYDPLTDTWSRMSTVGAPVARTGATAIWTGESMIVWGGDDGGSTPAYFDSGGRYDPSTDAWTPISTSTGTLEGRRDHTAVWTGTEMIVWGGCGAPLTCNTIFDDGARYDPASDGWTALASADAPYARTGHSSVWTGSEMIVWGGTCCNDLQRGDGARYDPITDAWTVTTAIDAPSARSGHVAVWTGSEMIVWGGSFNDFGARVYLQSGARFDPLLNRWTATSIVGGPVASQGIWTGSELITWGTPEVGPEDGGRYDPFADQWSPVSPVNGPRFGTVSWTGSLMLVYSGEAGGRYEPGTDSWTPIDLGPTARFGHSAVWTGSEMIVWGGNASPAVPLRDGFRYDPTLDALSEISTADAPEPRYDHTAVWTGGEMIVWGGFAPGGPMKSGGRYDPLGDSWIATSAANAPVERWDHGAVWTGSEMIVWGGNGAGSVKLGDGGRYDPSSDAWTPTSSTGAPGGRSGHSTIWTGSEMIVWGGSTGSIDNTGGRYVPGADSWSSTATVSAPNGRSSHSAVWTGFEMIVWGGSDSGGFARNDGSRYDPDQDSWTATTTFGAPDARDDHTAVWTGREMIVWGGGAPNTDFQTGGRYDVAQDSWTSVSTTQAPGGRQAAVSVWTGRDMVVWGGYAGALRRFSDGSRYSAVGGDSDADGIAELCDNCPFVSNGDQADGDADGRGDLCDNCPATVNTDQADIDADGAGNPCDACTDTDGDLFGDPGFVANICPEDNCPDEVNAGQLDSDSDSVGDLCDVCPLEFDPEQTDGDGDGSGDPCDCESMDPNDRVPAAVDSLTADRTGFGTIDLSWNPVAGSDAFSVHRGVTALLEVGSYGGCVFESTGTTFSDPDLPAPREVFTYLVQPFSFDCGAGPLGHDSSDASRSNVSPDACLGLGHTDTVAQSEESVLGSVSGDTSSTWLPDEVLEAITEEESTGAPSSRTSRLEHRWTFVVPAASSVRLHVEGFRSVSPDGDDFAFEYSIDGANWTPIALASLPTTEDQIDLVAVLPADLSGTVIVRVVDTNRDPGMTDLDTIWVDALMIRTVD